MRRRIEMFSDFGWEIALEADSRRPPIPLDTTVARTEGFTYASKVWDSSLVQGPFSVSPRQTVRFTTFHRCTLRDS
jgi:hypothetical protein